MAPSSPVLPTPPLEAPAGGYRPVFDLPHFGHVESNRSLLKNSEVQHVSIIYCDPPCARSQSLCEARLDKEPFVVSGRDG